ncbi:hypothetical protein GCM10028833_19200 [Glycomyces tarimensis]
MALALGAAARRVLGGGLRGSDRKGTVSPNARVDIADMRGLRPPVAMGYPGLLGAGHCQGPRIVGETGGGDGPDRLPRSVGSADRVPDGLDAIGGEIDDPDLHVAADGGF